MAEKIYLNLLILCGVLCHGIIAILPDEETSKSSDFLVRQRRVISHMPDGLDLTSIDDVNYIVNIRETTRSSCVGSILSHHTVITSALCVRLEVNKYSILAGSAYNSRHTLHNVTSKIINYGNLPHQHYDGIALLTVYPPFVYSSRIGNINLYQGDLSAGTWVTCSGWGCTYPPQPGPPGIRRGLRTVHLQIVNHGMCQSIYQDHYTHLNIPNPFVITDKHFCTYHPQQYCARTDIGAPLVKDDMLIGIHVFKGEFARGMNPDVFVNVQRLEYSLWIRQNIRF